MCQDLGNPLDDCQYLGRPLEVLCCRGCVPHYTGQGTYYFYYRPTLLVFLQGSKKTNLHHKHLRIVVFRSSTGNRLLTPPA
ncbi:hypothetical protein RRG08_000867 [Elysia crispata]|uniref:Uncharacterized protein n=1 Tax=Elysia crispata TaxID=231223 RepID=A0AAE0XTG9_9GAST|nr:hypothetical protein RRG08_000867 [Elysia crispata]